MSEKADMKLLKIDKGMGYFLKDKDYKTVDNITKEDLLNLVHASLGGDIIIDRYDEMLIKNQAHQIIYRSICSKLIDLNNRRDNFFDEKSRIYLDEYNKYKTAGY